MNDPKLQTLRLLVDRHDVRPAYRIPEYGFGLMEHTGMSPDGQLITIRRALSYRMACGHIVKNASELGGVCYGTRAFVEQNAATHPLIARLNPAERDFLATVCIKPSCYRTCSYPFCQRAGSRRFMSELQVGSGVFFCLEHHSQVQAEAGRQQGIVDEGPIRASLKGLVRWLTTT